MKKHIAILFLILSGCSTAHLDNESRAKINSAALISLLDDSFYVDAIGKSVLRSKELRFDVSSWKINDQLIESYKKLAAARNKNLTELAIDDGEKAKHGELSNAELRDSAIIAAQKNGFKYVFIANSLDKVIGYPIYRGPMGMVCIDRKLKKTNASAYFLYQVDLWEVETKKHLFHTIINPSITENIAPVKCADLKDISEEKLLQDLHKNVSEALERSVQFTFSKMDW